MALKKPSVSKSLVQKVLNLSFKKNALLDAALFHPSYRNEQACTHLEDFDRFEFFGDSILNYVICRQLLRTFPEADEGLLSRLRSILVSRKVLSRIAQEVGLGKVVRFGKSLSKEKDSLKRKIFADCLEALIAAYYFDRGLAKTEAFILRIFEGYFDSKKLLRIDPNPKSTLQEFAQRNWQRLPIYTNENITGGIRSLVAVPSVFKAAAQAKTRREAEEKAAQLLLRKLRQELVLRSKKKSSGRKL